LSKWFYPGDEWGEEFTSGKATWVAESKVETVTQVQTKTEVASAPAPALAPAPVAVAVAETNPPAREPASVVAEKAPAQLPKTGSNVPLFGLLGFGALAGAAALHLSRRMA
jgi:LPXTG-motif cell wall-anchored protein